MKGRVRRQERSDEFLQFRLIWGVPTGQSAAWCARVETRPCDRATTGVVWEAVEAEGMVCSRRLDSARPRKGISFARVAVDCMDSHGESVERAFDVCVLYLAVYKSSPS